MTAARGWLPFPRRVMLDPIFSDPERLGALMILNARAAYAPRVEEVLRYTEVHLRPGQLLYSERLMCEWTGWPRSKVRTIIAEFLEQKRIRFPAGTDYPHPYVLELADPWNQFNKSNAPQIRQNPTKTKSHGRVEAPPEKKGSRNQEPSRNRDETVKSETKKAPDKTSPSKRKTQAREGIVVSTAPKSNQALVDPPTVSKPMRGTSKPRRVENRRDMASQEQITFDPLAERNQQKREGGRGIKGEGVVGSSSSSAVEAVKNKNPPRTPPDSTPRPRPARKGSLPPELANGVFASLMERIQSVGLRGVVPHGRFLREDESQLTQLLRDYTPQQIETAIRGMGRLPPWSMGRPWGVRVLAQQFTVALAAAGPTDDSGRRQQRLIQQAREAFERRLDEWGVTASALWSNATAAEREEFERRAAESAPEGAPPEVRRRFIESAARTLYAEHAGEPQPQPPEFLK